MEKTFRIDEINLRLKFLKNTCYSLFTGMCPIWGNYFKFSAKEVFQYDFIVTMKKHLGP